MNKKFVIAGISVLTLAFGAYARPHYGGRCRTSCRPVVVNHYHGGGYRHCGGWGRGGRNFWPGFVGGVVGSIVHNAITTPAVTETVVVQQPVVVPQPVVVQPTTQVQSVWVEGRYVDQVQANGSVIKVWQPGHYEQRTVIVQ